MTAYYLMGELVGRRPNARVTRRADHGSGRLIRPLALGALVAASPVYPAMAREWWVLDASTARCRQSTEMAATYHDAAMLTPGNLKDYLIHRGSFRDIQITHTPDGQIDAVKLNYQMAPTDVQRTIAFYTRLEDCTAALARGLDVGVIVDPGELR